MSKLGYRACTLWVEGFNLRCGRRYRTRGCDGVWCWPWIAPRFPGSGVVDKDVAEAVKGESKRVRKEGRLDR